MTFLVFFAGAAGAGIVAADFSARAYWLGRFRLRRTRLILQIFLLALLTTFDLTRDLRKTLGFAGAGCSARSGGVSANRLQRTRRLGPGLSLRLFALLHLDVKQVANRFVVDARHHVFEQDKGFLLELDERIFLPVAP